MSTGKSEMPRCRTCKHWTRDSAFKDADAYEELFDWVDGACDQLRIRSRLFDLTCDEGGRHEINVSQNFGCVEHEAKP